jgi:sporulation protein YlmC with PRC-barrel domain
LGDKKMAIDIKRISEVYEKDVFTDGGLFFGKVNDAIVGRYLINGWVIRATPNSYLTKILKDVKAVIVPHKAVKAIGDIMLVSHNMELTKETE